MPRDVVKPLPLPALSGTFRGDRDEGGRGGRGDRRWTLTPAPGASIGAGGSGFRPCGSGTKAVRRAGTVSRWRERSLDLRDLEGSRGPPGVRGRRLGLCSSPVSTYCGGNSRRPQSGPLSREPPVPRALTGKWNASLGRRLTRPLSPEPREQAGGRGAGLGTKGLRAQVSEDQSP